ncbi:uncharacterized protein GIQ15_02062 [Arthroderma uncinatum]|uniref:uncharacterized protein n=1 Tax=Arthroderma uncinatum TaxID=74035 RepID=UPI00144A90E7|nr:uncharacterized protein GIQ15_02062 [Arthroderma uncinatum]KAF3482738.1 hypothetical protein GIQ15_02062 [Arthroderma uncinatum]
MALVTYSDSEGESDTETKPVEQSTATSQLPASKSKTSFKPLVDRGNPRKILVNLSETKPGRDGTDSGPDKEDGPARKRLRTGGGGLFSGFNDMLPAPKRTGAARNSTDKTQPVPARSKPFTLKTSAEPGFDRSGNADNLSSYDEFGKPSSANETSHTSLTEGSKSSRIEPVFEKKGNSMMFKPLSVARNKPKKKTTGISPLVATSKAAGESPLPSPQAKVKPKVSLFGLSDAAETAPNMDTDVQNAPYESLLYTGSSEPASASTGQALDDSTGVNTATSEAISSQKVSTQPQDLASVASDLNLSRSEMRQLLGRDLKGASSKVLNFNTDEEYKANSAYLSNTSEAELAAQQHRPVRAVAPGKHSLSQLVNAVTSQRDALEDSFATGKRSRKEASSRYGW